MLGNLPATILTATALTTAVWAWVYVEQGVALSHQETGLVAGLSLALTFIARRVLRRRRAEKSDAPRR